MPLIEQVVQVMIDFKLDEDNTIGDLLIVLRKQRKQGEVDATQNYGGSSDQARE